MPFQVSTTSPRRLRVSTTPARICDCVAPAVCAPRFDNSTPRASASLNAPSSATRRLFPLIAPSSRPDPQSNFPPSPHCSASVAQSAHCPSLRENSTTTPTDCRSFQTTYTIASEEKPPRRTRLLTSSPALPPTRDCHDIEFACASSAPRERSTRHYVGRAAASGAQPQPIPQSFRSAQSQNGCPA